MLIISVTANLVLAILYVYLMIAITELRADVVAIRRIQTATPLPQTHTASTATLSLHHPQRRH